MSVLIRLADHAPDQVTSDDLDSVEGAIRLIDAGAARRVVLVNLADAEEVLPLAIAAGQQVGITVRGDRSTGRLAIEVGAGS
jgi:hypothetical protein